ncbi:MAG: hypothetical protein P8R04_02560 [Gammaproteobacteria bacterium]|nr:hypothetical protein [Gammaproteobacteria bacterium]
MKKQLIFSALLATALLGSGSVWAVTADDVDCNGCVRGNEIAKQTITQKNIAKGSIGEYKIKDRAVTADKLSDEVYSALVSAQSLYLVDANGLQVGDTKAYTDDYMQNVGVLFSSPDGPVLVVTNKDNEDFEPQLRTETLGWGFYLTSNCSGTKYYNQYLNYDAPIPPVVQGFVDNGKLYREDVVKTQLGVGAFPDNGSADLVAAYRSYSNHQCQKVDLYGLSIENGLVTVYLKETEFVKDLPAYQAPLQLELR